MGSHRSSRTGLTVPLTVIAATANVSVATVSKVLNGRSDVAEVTRARVIDALHRHGQSPTKPRRKATGMIDLRVENLKGTWAEELIRGVVDAAKTAGLDVVISAGPLADPQHNWVSHSLTRGTDGLIAVVGIPTPRDRVRIREAGLPLVVIDPWTAPGDTCLSVGVTNWQGAFDATKHLISLGHTRIATITGSTELTNAQARLGGFRSAMAEAGLHVDEDLIRTGDYTSAAGYQAAQYFLKLEEPPTAIFAASDDSALGALRAYREHGLRAPHDISLVGFDDLPLARWVDPALTTVRQPLEQMGSLAINLITRHRADLPLVPRVELATSLMVRGTTAQARKS